MQVISVLAQKGGAGKTTLLLHWAIEAQHHGHVVAILDADRQASASKWGEKRIARGLDAPAVVPLHRLEASLKDVLSSCRDDGITLALIDTMPRVEEPSLEAAEAADFAVIPCNPTLMDIEAIGDTIGIVNRVKTPAGIIVNRGKPGTRELVEAPQLLGQYGIPVCPFIVMDRSLIHRAFNDGRTVRELEPMGKAAQEIAATWAWIAKNLKPSKRT